MNPIPDDDTPDPDARLAEAVVHLGAAAARLRDALAERLAEQADAMARALDTLTDRLADEKRETK